jgi:hypothetical protein
MIMFFIWIKKILKASKVFLHLRLLEDAKEIKNHIEEYDINEAVVLGGGLIGIKSLESLLDLNIKVNIVELSDRSFPLLSTGRRHCIMEEIIRGMEAISICLILFPQSILKNNLISSVVLKTE